MTTYKIGDIVLIGFPHSDLKHVAKRPAVILYDSGDEDVLEYVHSLAKQLVSAWNGYF